MYQFAPISKRDPQFLFPLLGFVHIDKFQILCDI